MADSNSGRIRPVGSHYLHTQTFTKGTHILYLRASNNYDCNIKRPKVNGQYVN